MKITFYLKGEFETIKTILDALEISYNATEDAKENGFTVDIIEITEKKNLNDIKMLIGCSMKLYNER